MANRQFQKNICAGVIGDCVASKAGLQLRRAYGCARHGRSARIDNRATNTGSDLLGSSCQADKKGEANTSKSLECKQISHVSPQANLSTSRRDVRRRERCAHLAEFVTSFSGTPVPTMNEQRNANG